ncbi:MAG: methionyl-tRNA formyltransferase [Pseudomonadota bacterium]
MKIIFAGTPPFATAALTTLHAAGHEIVLVLSQPDRPAGRGMKLTPSAVTNKALQLGLPIAKPASLKNVEAHDLVRKAGADVMVVAAYGLLLPQIVLDIPRYGCLNIHGSILPRWRGAAPVQRAIEAGDIKTGIGIMQMDTGLDTGPVLLERNIDISPDETSASLFAKLSSLGASAIVEALGMLPTLSPRIQSAVGITYAKKIEKIEAIIDWNMPAEVIERRIRAFDPFPGCETVIGNERLKIWRAFSADNALNAPPGNVFEINSESITIACGKGALRITNVQRPGSKRISAADWLRARSTPILPGALCQ